MTIKLANNAISTLAGPLTAIATTMTVQTGDGAKYPALSGPDYFLSTLVKLVAGVQVYEIVKVTARAGDVFTIVRGQEGTTATTFSALDRVENRLTRDTFTEFPQKTDTNVMTGANTFGGATVFNGTVDINAAVTLDATLTATADVTMTGASIIEAEGAPVASGATTNIWATDGNTVHVTGVTGITSFGTAPQAGAWMKVIFDGALTLTHSANLNLNNNGSDVTVAADDLALVYADSTTQFDVFIIRKNGNPVANLVIPGMTLLATLTPTAAANLDALNVFSSTYDDYLILGENIKAAANDSPRIRYANAGAADTGSNYYENSGAPSTDTSAAAFLAPLVSSSVLAAGKGLNFQMWVQNVNDASNIKSSIYSANFQSDATPTYASANTFGFYPAANTITGLRFYWNTGSNFAAVGKIRIYGISKT